MIYFCLGSIVCFSRTYVIDALSEDISLLSPAGVQDADLSVLSQTMAQCCKNIKETVQMLASRHKDIHGSVSKVGKAIDRVRTLSNVVLQHAVRIFLNLWRSSAEL